MTGFSRLIGPHLLSPHEYTSLAYTGLIATLEERTRARECVVNAFDHGGTIYEGHSNLYYTVFGNGYYYYGFDTSKIIETLAITNVENNGLLLGLYQSFMV